MTEIKVHRGSHEIGGSIVEIYTEDTHIFIDFGSELSVDPERSTDGKMVDMIRHAECDAVLFTHYHGDHIGLISGIPEKDIRGRKIGLYMGSVARQVLRNIHTTLSDFDDQPEEELQKHRDYIALLDSRVSTFDDSGESFDIGDFNITPVMADHSAYDAYMFIIESRSDHRVIVHTGDFRTHGRLGEDLFDKVKKAIGGRRVDTLIIEGTMMSRLTEKVRTERELQTEAAELLARPENKYAYLICSSTNVESLASFANAAFSLRPTRAFFVNPYVKEQIDLYRRTAGADDEDFKFKKTYAFEPQDRINPRYGTTQPEFMEEHGFLMLIGTSEAYRLRMKRFEKYDPLLIYSMWDGYINRKKYPDTYREDLGGLYNSWPENRRVSLHTSGHATAEDIRKMILTVAPEKHILPIHTEEPEAFYRLDIGRYADLIDIVGDER
ncbi:MAG: MBL fold metallo-hydrolase [Lachnospiraceae bacterium]|nr:MBL fold metallo-hydrolase [Lachnospiraceae bacterium]